MEVRTCALQKIRDELWCDASPIWARPQDGGIEMYPLGYLQVVGHTPVRKTDYFGELVTVDNYVMSENTLYKHLPLTDVIEHVVTTRK